jgi:hypothetical protein
VQVHAQQGGVAGAQHPPHQQASGGQYDPARAAGAGTGNSTSQPVGNAFAWKAPKAKPDAVSTSNQYMWDDGRQSNQDSRPQGVGSATPGTPSWQQQHADRRWDRSQPDSQANLQVNSPYQGTPYSASGSAGGYLGRDSNNQANQAQTAPAQPPQDKWPPKLQTFVENSFKQCNGEYERTCMQNTLKMIIQNATKNNRIWSTDWDGQPLPRVTSLPTGSIKTDNKKDSSASSAKDDDRRGSNRQTRKMRRKIAEPEAGEADLEADREAREKRHKRFIEMERGNTGSSNAGMNNDLDGETKFMSSEAVVGTCMEMEKMYIRLQSMPDPATVRPERVLVKWAERLQVKYDTDEADWEWISDQFKAIRQDMVIQHIRSANAITAYETNARLALQEQDYPEFYKIQSFLMGLYKDNPDWRANEAEFMAYRLFYWMLNNNTVDMTKDIRNMDTQVKQHPCIKHAVRLHQALELSDYVSFFRLYSETANMGKCIVDTLRDRMRTRALRVVLRAYKPSFPVDFVQAQLGFRVTGGIDEMLNSSLGMGPEDEDDGDNWAEWADAHSLVSVPEVRSGFRV